MTYLSIFEKLKILFDMIVNTKIVLIFIGFVIILTFLYLFKRINRKKYMLLLFIALIITVVINTIGNYKILSNTFDNFMTIFFSNIYFPSIYVYISVLVITFITFITSMLSTKQRGIYKVINSIMFILNGILFVIVLNIIAKNKIDIFSITSLYTNKTLVAILEINILIFVIWIIANVIIYITNCICDSKKTNNNNNLELEENNRINEENSVLLSNNNKLTEENKILSEDNNRINKENGVLLSDNNKLIKENKILSDDNNRINEENSLLLTNNNKLTEENKILSDDNNRINEENSLLLTNNNKLTEENKILSEDNNRINEENSLLLTNNNKLTEENKILSDDNNRLIKENTILLESNNKLLKEKDSILKDKALILNNDNKFECSINDIVNSKIEVKYYDNNLFDDYEYNIINPQEIYEKKYNKLVSKEENEKDIIENVNELIDDETFDIKNYEKNDNIHFDESISETEILIDDIGKKQLVDERLLINTISLSELSTDEITYEIKDDVKENKDVILDDVTYKNDKNDDIKEENAYTIDDYKQIIKMLNSIKNHSNNSIISVDDAINISLISNYSIDDCLKFKDILESNLN